MLVPQVPCYKVFKESAQALRIVWVDAQQNAGHFRQDCVGDFLIHFLELDLTTFIKSLKQFGEGTQFDDSLLFDQGYRKTKEQLFDAADLLVDNLHLHRLLVGAMEMIFEDETLSDMEQLEKAYLELLYIVQMYNQFSDGLAFCLDGDKLPGLSIAKKFAMFMQTSKRFVTYKFQTGYAIAPVDKQGNLNFETVEELNAAEADVIAQIDTIHEGQSGVSLIPFTWFLSFEDMIFYDFLELVSRGLAVKRCKLCGRYFVQKTRHKTEYCERKTENGRTCKQVGPKILFNAELAKPENATLKEYDRIRKAKQQKLERDRNKESGRAVGKAQAAYDKWSEMAAALREQFVKGEISEEKLLAEIN